MTHRWFPILRPGALILRRDDAHLQVGTAPGIVIADRPGLMHLLTSLDGATEVAALEHRYPAMEQLPDLLDDLLVRGVVYDASGWAAGTWNESRAAALADETIAVADRTSYRVAIHADSSSDHLGRTVRDLLSTSGIRHLDSPEPDLLIVISGAEPPRGVFTSATWQGLSHLPVRHAEDRILIGPAVLPGVTPCVNCHDLHRADWDPSWSVLIPQFGGRPAYLNPPAPTALTQHAGAIEIAAVALQHLAGQQPLSGTVLAIGPEHHERTHWQVPFHPRCSCSLLTTGHVRSA